MALVVLLMAAGPGAAEWSLGKGHIWIGPPANPERYYRFATDNGIPGTGHYAYFDYNWPSLRQALDQYGWFGRRYRGYKPPRRPAPLAPLPAAAPDNRSTLDSRSLPDEGDTLKAPRKLEE
jgi:hypothetical protein